MSQAGASRFVFVFDRETPPFLLFGSSVGVGVGAYVIMQVPQQHP